MAIWQEWGYRASVWVQAFGRFMAVAAQSPGAVIGVNLCLIAVLSYNLADVTWRLMPAVVQPPVPIQGPSVKVAPQNQAFDIARWHLFGEQQKTDVSASQTRVMPETRLKLVLRGVVAGEDGDVSGAIIASPSGDQSFYALGAALPGGATLKEVHDRHIVLLRNGQLETLRLPRDDLDVGDSNDGASRIDSSPVGAPLMSLSEYRDTLLQNPQQLADVVQARPYHRDGISGYQINPGRDPALFTQLGLQANDVITMVNGIRLDNPARGLSILQALRQQPQVTVEVIRDGIPQTLSIDLNQ